MPKQSNVRSSENFPRYYKLSEKGRTKQSGLLRPASGAAQAAVDGGIQLLDAKRGLENHEARLLALSAFPGKGCVRMIGNRSHFPLLLDGY